MNETQFEVASWQKYQSLSYTMHFQGAGAHRIQAPHCPPPHPLRAPHLRVQQVGRGGIRDEGHRVHQQPRLEVQHHRARQVHPLHGAEKLRG